MLPSNLYRNPGKASFADKAILETSYSKTQMYASIFKAPQKTLVTCILHSGDSGMVPPQLKRLRFLKLFQLEPRLGCVAMSCGQCCGLGCRCSVVNHRHLTMTKHRYNSSVMVQHGSTILHFSSFFMNYVQLFSIFHVGAGSTCLFSSLFMWEHVAYTFPSLSRCLNPP